ncbi:endonuclease/exonuclease/phosphatase family protein [Pseudohongiella sp.]|uniref:Endonuclease/exonuclease/phosphatase domain-containing protein n=1 Tax=marine sediment metagenome TaxID=412755 RepID=A0A0F9Z175_9ZZZZ|nr:endonuclease/exonuclease/phosphatase family protein [Pseudohongiella sp.]
MITALAWANILLIFVCLVPLWRNEHWLVRSLDFPRLQFSVALVIVLLADLLILDLVRPVNWILIAGVGACLCFQAWWILPYGAWHKKEVGDAAAPDPDNTLSLITANVLTPNRNAEALIALVRQCRPDILVTLESDSWWQQRLDTLDTDYPYSIKCPLDNLYGMHVYSRLPLMNPRVEYLVEDDVPSMYADVVLPSGQRIQAHFLHPAPPSPTENETSGPRDKELVMVARLARGVGGPRLVTGDLNDVAWSETTRLFRKISGLLDPRVGRGMFNSFHAKFWFCRWPLDHLFVSHHFTLSGIRRLAPYGSDHFAIFAELVLAPGNGQKGNGPEADSDDKAFARDKIS